MRPLLSMIAAVALLLPTDLSAAPNFAPNPRQAFDGFVAINPPRADVPVGALWINGYGPTGDGAAKDNLETVRSISSLSIDKNLQLSLSLGILNLLGVDPKARDHYTARFSDISIVRVKDVSKLAGVKGEPRIIEALKAGTVTVSSDTNIGLTGQTIGNQWSATGSTQNDRTRTYSIEARDMFIAIHVATAEVTRSKEQELRLSADRRTARLDDYLIVIAHGPSCRPSPDMCTPNFGVAKLNSQTVGPGQAFELGAVSTASLPLPVPTSDNQGGLYDKLVLRWIAPCSEQKSERCGNEPRLFAHYEGTRTAEAKSATAKGW